VFGVVISTVAGKFKMILFSGVGFQIAITASQMRLANGNSVPVKLSGEYSMTISVSPIASASSRTLRVPRSAIATMPSSSSPNTTRRCSVDVEL
jgi:hypothetical protein